MGWIIIAAIVLLGVLWELLALVKAFLYWLVSLVTMLAAWVGIAIGAVLFVWLAFEAWHVIDRKRKTWKFNAPDDENAP